jgi:hypothetical protein
MRPKLGQALRDSTEDDLKQKLCSCAMAHGAEFFFEEQQYAFLHATKIGIGAHISLD